jgi:uncharacterized RDD family membrane protein YckC
MPHMPILSVSTAFNLDLDFECAPFPKRLGAFMLDTILLTVYVYFLSKIGIQNRVYLDENLQLIFDLITYIPLAMYHLICELAFKGQSFGKKVMKLRVISADGSVPSVAQLLLRWFCNPSGFILIGILIVIFYGGIWGLITTAFYFADFILVLVTKYSQRIGDLAAQTVVVTHKLPYSIDDTIYKKVDEDLYQVRYPEVIKLSDRDINTVNNILLQFKKYKVNHYVQTVVDKVQNVLKIEMQEEGNIEFLERLIRDYNYLTQKD